MIYLKNAQQLECMRKAGAALYEVEQRLREIIADSLKNNRDLRVAALNVDKARAMYGIGRASLLPSINASGELRACALDTATPTRQGRLALALNVCGSAPPRRNRRRATGPGNRPA